MNQHAKLLLQVRTSSDGDWNTLSSSWNDPLKNDGYKFLIKQQNRWMQNYVPFTDALFQIILEPKPVKKAKVIPRRSITVLA